DYRPVAKIKKRADCIPSGQLLRCRRYGWQVMRPRYGAAITCTCSQIGRAASATPVEKNLPEYLVRSFAPRCENDCARRLHRIRKRAIVIACNIVLRFPVRAAIARSKPRVVAATETECRQPFCADRIHR